MWNPWCTHVRTRYILRAQLYFSIFMVIVGISAISTMIMICIYIPDGKYILLWRLVLLLFWSVSAPGMQFWASTTIGLATFVQLLIVSYLSPSIQVRI